MFGEDRIEGSKGKLKESVQTNAIRQDCLMRQACLTKSGDLRDRGDVGGGLGLDQPSGSLLRVVYSFCVAYTCERTNSL